MIDFYPKHEYRIRFKVGTPLADAGLRGERKVSRLVNDTYHSLCGRFSAISRNIFAEQKVPMRFYPTNPSYDPNFVELWVDGSVVATVKSRTLAINWIVLKVSRSKETGRKCPESTT